MAIKLGSESAAERRRSYQRKHAVSESSAILGSGGPRKIFRKNKEIAEMINGKTFYQILGVLPDAEDIVIRAAYRSLSQKYHPDKWTEDPKISNERMAKINRAYETLSDNARRAEYDEELRSTNKESDFDSDSSPEEEFQEFYRQTESDWLLAVEYFPEIESMFRYLKRINYGLAFAFRQVLLETKAFEKSNSIFNAYKLKFLTRYFGSDKAILEFAEMLIVGNFRHAAIELNKVINVLGGSKNASFIIKKIKEKFPEATDQKTGFRMYENFQLYETKKIDDFTCVFFSEGECAIIDGNNLRIYDSEKNMRDSILNHGYQNMFLRKGLLRVIDI